MRECKVRKRHRRSWLAIGCALAAVWPACIGTVRAEDAGFLRVTTQGGNAQVDMYTNPTPPRVGIVELNLVVHPPVGRRRGLPSFEVSYWPLKVPARKRTIPDIRPTGVNKPFLAGEMEVTEPGPWEVEVGVEYSEGVSGPVRFRMDVEESEQNWSSFGIWVGLPVVGIMGFVAARRLLARRGPRRAIIAATDKA